MKKKDAAAGITRSSDVFHPPALPSSFFFCFKPTIISGFNSHSLNTALKIKAQTAIIESQRGGPPPTAEVVSAEEDGVRQRATVSDPGRKRGSAKLAATQHRSRVQHGASSAGKNPR